MLLLLSDVLRVINAFPLALSLLFRSNSIGRELGIEEVIVCLKEVHWVAELSSCERIDWVSFSFSVSVMLSLLLFFPLQQERSSSLACSPRSGILIEGKKELDHQEGRK